MARYIWFIPLLLFVVFLSACGDQYDGDFSYEVQDFEFTNQDGEEVSKSDLDGKFWVADFIFTNCTTVCPPMTANMSTLQDQLKEAGLEDEVQLVSFSVDPERDKPETLKAYAEARGGTFENWDLLTGYDFETIKEFSIKSFKSAVEELPDSDQIMHGTSFFIVTPEGNAIKNYDGRDGSNMEKIVKDIQEMI
ncbi:SCO family protein [Lentibacillus sp. CBA3610]|uniref:SCO family protein n=1 Tax=Lentibacillus sp. CBA3610 TaxID=2518176 RepID=UPI0015960525|nr:SCO family protein [Lentibacillus sp. CBA3610]QKY68898.1 SCO family protein [Lentibacillus sp. CBA3610]